MDILSIDDFRGPVPDDDDTTFTEGKSFAKQTYSTQMDPLKEQVFQDPTYIRWQIFDEIPEWVYTRECEGYFDKNGNPLTDDESIKHLISGEQSFYIDDELELCDENGYVTLFIQLAHLWSTNQFW